MGWTTVFCYERVITVLQMGTNSNFISLIILIYKSLISAYWSKIDLLLFVKVPAIINLLKFFRIKPLILRCCWVFIILFDVFGSSTALFRFAGLFFFVLIVFAFLRQFTCVLCNFFCFNLILKSLELLT